MKRLILVGIVIGLLYLLLGCGCPSDNVTAPRTHYDPSGVAPGSGFGTWPKQGMPNMP